MHPDNAHAFRLVLQTNSACTTESNANSEHHCALDTCILPVQSCTACAHLHLFEQPDICTRGTSAMLAVPSHLVATVSSKPDQANKAHQESVLRPT